MPSDSVPDDGQSWHDMAACRGSGVNFHPERGEDARPAKAVCAGCPVREQCLDDALADSTRKGIWGGTSERERRRMRADGHTADARQHLVPVFDGVARRPVEPAEPEDGAWETWGVRYVGRFDRPAVCRRWCCRPATGVLGLCEWHLAAYLRTVDGPRTPVAAIPTWKVVPGSGF